MNKKSNLGVIILAAGLGTRMESQNQKVLFELNNKPILDYVIESVLPLKPKKISIVVGHKSEEVKKHVSKKYENKFYFVLQRKRLGTAHATKCAKKIFENSKVKDILVINGDTPFISSNTLSNMYKHHINTNSLLTFLVAKVSNPKGYGRVKIDSSKIKIIEETDLTNNESSINLINAGAYSIKHDVLWKALDKIKKNPKKNEYYITDIVEILSNMGKVSTYTTDNEIEVLNINTKLDLEKARGIIEGKDV